MPIALIIADVFSQLDPLAINQQRDVPTGTVINEKGIKNKRPNQGSIMLNEIRNPRIKMAKIKFSVKPKKKKRRNGIS
jgi:hypothetical protein